MKVLIFLTALFTVVVTQELTSIQEFADGNIAFTAQVYKELIKDEEAGFIVSPLSADIILALIDSGAEGQTAEELRIALNLPSTQERTASAFKTLLPLLTVTSEKLNISTANKIFVNQSFEIKEDFKTIASTNFDAGVEQINFDDKKAAVNEINSWVEGETHNKIHNLVDASTIDDDTVVVLVNTLYFMAPFKNPFHSGLTAKKSFYKSEKEVVDVDMMHATNMFGYYEDDDVKYLTIPFADDRVSLTIVLPHENEGLTKTEQSVEKFLQPLDASKKLVVVDLPIWTSESKYDFVQILEKLGVSQLFSANANLSGISDSPIEISQIVQKSFINVTETGTEAASATEGGAVPTIVPELSFVADHPFLYVIRENDNGVILFVGRYVG